MYSSLSLSICWDGRVLAGAFTGTQRYILDLIFYLTREYSQHTYFLLVNQRSLLAVGKLLLHMPNPPKLVCIESLPDLLFIRQWDVFHFTYQSHLKDLFKIKPYTKRVVVTLHDLIAYDGSIYHKNSRDWLNYRDQVELGLMNCDAIITPSNYVRDQVKGHFPQLSTPVYMIHHGASVIIGKEKKIRFLFYRQLKIKRPKKYFLCIGTDFPHKNLMGTLNFYRYLLEKKQIINPLLFVGPHADQGNLDEIKKKVSDDVILKGNVFFRGGITAHEIPVIYREASLLLYLSLSEGFGFPPLEAFFYGCPVVASHCTSIPEVLGSRFSYFNPDDFTSLGDEVERLTRDMMYREEHLAKGKLRVEELSWIDTAQKTASVYSTACCHHRLS